MTKRMTYLVAPMPAWLAGLLGIALGVTVGLTGLVFADDVSTALYSIVVNTTNTGASDCEDVQGPFNLSAATLIDGDFITSDALNTQIHKGTTDVPNMPPTTRIQLEGAVTQDGGVFTDVTSEAQSTAQNDVPILPVVPVVDDAFYFGCDNPCRITTWDVDTAGVNILTLTWEYWDGSAFRSLANVDDRTSTFTALGRNTISWDMPSDWETRATTGSGVSSFWGRGRVSDFTSQTTQPLGTQVFYETGQWWTFIPDLDVDTQEQVTLFIGGSTAIRATHQLFVGTAGLTTSDAVTLETSGTYVAHVFGRLDFSAAGSSTFLINKTGAITVNVSGSAIAPAIGTSITDAFGTSTGDVSGITVPTSGEQNIIIAADGVNAATWVDAGGGMTSYQVRGITDNGNNWSWITAGGVDYIESIRLNADVASTFNFETNFADFNSGTQTNTQPYTGRLGLDNQ